MPETNRSRNLKVRLGMGRAAVNYAAAATSGALPIARSITAPAAPKANAVSMAHAAVTHTNWKSADALPSRCCHGTTCCIARSTSRYGIHDAVPMRPYVISAAPVRLMKRCRPRRPQASDPFSLTITITTHAHDQSVQIAVKYQIPARVRRSEAP